MERLPTTNVDITFRATQMEEVLARGPCHIVADTASNVVQSNPHPRKNMLAHNCHLTKLANWADDDKNQARKMYDKVFLSGLEEGRAALVMIPKTSAGPGLKALYDAHLLRRKQKGDGSIMCNKDPNAGFMVAMLLTAPGVDLHLTEAR
mmetsp:Transcript_16580/g.63020  ORF Transcript_16580/g.63020 Transcript_16580/m.63020 type:complete len:149 (-) Transcript_16580:278-724(-)